MRHRLARKGSEKNFTNICQTSEEAITKYTIIYIIFKSVQHTLDFLTAVCTSFIVLIERFRLVYPGVGVP